MYNLKFSFTQLLCKRFFSNKYFSDYAFWCVTSIDVKDIEAINYLLSRLLPHAKVLAKDHLFCYSLILHLDRVRKAALPDNEHIKLLRAVFEHLSISSKCDLLTTLQSSLKNSNRSTPLPNSTVHFRTRIRQLFNRLVVSNVNSGDDNYDNNQQVLNLFNKDIPVACLGDREHCLAKDLRLAGDPCRFVCTVAVVARYSASWFASSVSCRRNMAVLSLSLGAAVCMEFKLRLSG
ncbi:unnamed protein product [Schistosoma curassoni]|uniref:PIK helical domain-containing protein n=1 Tax=Schistosoma curassoni TaxID=6186 RepID=A0A183JMT6_9TREM|nr:unnamed protein product [Schistosoma curassoni]